MRRTWNSWTYYGSDNKPERSVEERRRGFERSLADALERAMDLSEVRMERVERVKKQLHEGSYKVSSEDLAQKLMNNMRGYYR